MGRHTQVATTLDRMVVVGSTIGPKREANEDRVCSATIARAEGRPPIFVAIVCDGIGGQKKGEESACVAMSAFLTECALACTDEIEEILAQSVHAANAAVFEITKGQGGTTLVALLIDSNGDIGLVNCGDSRVYSFGPEGLAQLTHDQTVAAAVEEAAGESERDTLGLRSFGAELGNYIGIGADFSPEFLAPQVKADTSFLLATDGIWNALEGTFPRILQASPDYTEAARRLLAVVNYAGGGDNASLAIVSSAVRPQPSVDNQNLVLQDQIRFDAITPNGSFVFSAVDIALNQPGRRLAHPLKILDKPRRGNKKKTVLSKIQQPTLPLEDGASPASAREARRGKRPKIEVVLGVDNGGGENTTD